MKKAILFVLCAVMLAMSPAFSFISLSTVGEYQYEVYEPDDSVPPSVAEEGLQMYYNAYLRPRLHAGLSLEELHIDGAKYSSYEEFIDRMFREDFSDCQNPHLGKRYYFQARSVLDGKVVGVCLVLCREPTGFYFIEHIGTHADYRRQGIGSELLEKVKQTLADFKEIFLDTRVFNKPAQALYEKAGYRKLQIHPIPAKQSTYCRYVLVREPPDFSPSTR